MTKHRTKPPRAERNPLGVDSPALRYELLCNDGVLLARSPTREAAIVTADAMWDGVVLDADGNVHADGFRVGMIRLRGKAAAA